MDRPQLLRKGEHLKKILLLGPTGQVGWELQRALAPEGNVMALGRSDRGGDLSDLVTLIQVARELRPNVIVNAAAWTAVDDAEQHALQAELINAQAPAALGAVAREIDALLVHFSTDYVFDGSGSRPWTENDPTGPLNVYGKTKRHGELGILASSCRHLIFRTSWVFASRGKNFLRTILRLGAERDSLRVVADQHGAPTSADLIADVTARAVTAVGAGAPGGVYHLVASGVTTWHGFAARIIECARAAGLPIRAREVEACATADFPTPARRPANSRLDTAHLRQTLDLSLPAWETGVERAVSELSGK